MPALKRTPDRNTLIVKLKTNAIMTVDRGTLDTMSQIMGQDTTSLVHLALARLRDDIQRGALTSLNAVPPIAQAWPGPEEMQAIRHEVDKGRAGGGAWQGSPGLDAAMALL
jgi:hypothetical protein